MVIGIDGNEANQTHRVGVGQYAYHLLYWLNLINTRHQFIIYLKDKPLRDLPKKSRLWQYRVIGPKPVWTKIALPIHLLLTSKQLNLFYSPSHYSPNPSPIPTIPTIHDIGYLKSKDEFNKKDIFQLTKWTETSIRQAKHIISVSEFTKNELIKTYHLPPEKISVVPNSVDPPSKSNLKYQSAVLKKFKINSPYFLSVGTLKPNKNYSFLIECFAKFLKLSDKFSNYSLVIAGKKGWIYDDIFATVKKLYLSSQVIFTDFISDQERSALYRQALATVIPSLYEGFGIPAIESQKVGTPVIASHIPPLIEVLKDSAIFINPQNQPGLIAALKSITNPTIRKKYILKSKLNSKNLNWKNSARLLLQVFESQAKV